MTLSRSNFRFHFQIWQRGAESAQKCHVTVKLLGQRSGCRTVSRRPNQVDEVDLDTGWSGSSCASCRRSHRCGDKPGTCTASIQKKVRLRGKDEFYSQPTGNFSKDLRKMIETWNSHELAALCCSLTFVVEDLLLLVILRLCSTSEEADSLLSYAEACSAPNPCWGSDFEIVFTACLE